MKRTLRSDSTVDEYAENPNDQLKKLLQQGSNETQTTFDEYFLKAVGGTLVS